MPLPLYITAYASIAHQQVSRNGGVVFESTDAPVNIFLPAAYRQLGTSYPKFFKMDNLARLGWLTTEVLLQGIVLTQMYDPLQIGIVFCNANSSLDADLRYIESLKEMASPALFVYTLPNIVIGEICISHNLKGENAFFIFESFDAAFVEQYVAGLFNNNILQACICGWVDCAAGEYKAVLFLVEKEANRASSGDYQPVAFTQENLNQIYQSNNG